eukprot:NODE_1995_length_679_cov_322.565079_g1559_i0.p1 GENE.NODE_1995_length_679_cov_322.565079_g1559_i0~~NODE_1995_length_679_cov_322.565079_g1559_i0.p1  ORF type:complete len:178 (-),score=61.42 NODE_1995_length_679_cov_322.565079_g1559_i0:144-620(-)
MSFTLLNGKWSGDEQVFNGNDKTTAYRTATVKGAVSASEGTLTLRFSHTSSDGLTTQNNFTFAFPKEGDASPVEGSELQCTDTTHVGIDAKCIQLKDCGLGLFLLRAVDSSNLRYDFVLTITVTAAELVTSTTVYDEQGRSKSISCMRGAPVEAVASS